MRLLEVEPREGPLGSGREQALVVIDRASNGHAWFVRSAPLQVGQRTHTLRNLRTKGTLTRRSIMSTKNIPLGTQEHEILRAIARSAATSARAITLSSTQRLRFEMLGLIEDRADGIRLTERGRAIAAAPSETPQAKPDQQQHAPAPRDRRGRRLGLRRRSPF